MKARTFASVVLAALASFPFAVLAMWDADSVHPHDWRGVIVSPGTAFAAFIDTQLPVHGGLLSGLGRGMCISFATDCLLYCLLLFPIVHFILMPNIFPRVAKCFPTYSGDAFWMQK